MSVNDHNHNPRRSSPSNGIIKCSACERSILFGEGEFAMVVPCGCTVCYKCLMNAHARRAPSPLSCPGCNLEASAHQCFENGIPDERIIPYQSRLPTQRFACTSREKGVYPTIKEYVSLCSDNDNAHDAECSGHLVSTSSGDTPGWAVIILENPDTNAMVPCLCPASFLDEPAIEALKKKVNSESKFRTMHASRRCALNVPVASTPVHGTSGARGHLVLAGPRQVKGRVADDELLAALRSGCLRAGAESSQSFYTLDRRFAPRGAELMDVARTVVASADGALKLRPVGRPGVAIMLRLGHSAVDSRLVFHKEISKAVFRLDRASELPPPSLEEKLLQISIGGDPGALAMGRFLPCLRLYDEPDITVRCACGFVVDADDAALRSQAVTLLRRRCNRKKDKAVVKEAKRKHGSLSEGSEEKSKDCVL